jgi:hypothetical protein
MTITALSRLLEVEETKVKLFHNPWQSKTRLVPKEESVA